jgi:hypothetical protein
MHEKHLNPKGDIQIDWRFFDVMDMNSSEL